MLHPRPSGRHRSVESYRGWYHGTAGVPSPTHDGNGGRSPMASPSRSAAPRNRVVARHGGSRGSHSTGTPPPATPPPPAAPAPAPAAPSTPPRGAGAPR